MFLNEECHKVVDVRGNMSGRDADWDEGHCENGFLEWAMKDGTISTSVESNARQERGKSLGLL